MTENSWPENGGFETPARGQSTATPTASARSADSKSDAAKDEAGELARHATDAAQSVTETAKNEAANVAAEAKTNARELMAQAKSDLTEQAGSQQQKVAEGLRSISTELDSMVSASDQPGVATDLVRQAAERSSAVASWLDERDPGSLLAEVTSFARAKPGTFLLLAAGAGVLAGRLSRSLSAGAPDRSEPAGTKSATVAPVADTPMSVPPVPVQPPANETPTRESAGAYPPVPFGVTETFPSDQLGSEVESGTDRPELWHAEPVVTDPLRNDPFDGGRR